MQTTFSPADLRRSVISVPPLCRDAKFKSSAAENAKLIKHIESGGVNTLLYGGNANFYNISLAEYESVLDQLESAAAADTWIIPAIGPYYGTAADQIDILKHKKFPTAMLLPTMAVSKPEGVRDGVLKLAESYGKPIVLYIKDEGYVNIDVVKSLVSAGVISWIKYAVVRADPAQDAAESSPAVPHANSMVRVPTGRDRLPAVVLEPEPVREVLLRRLGRVRTDHLRAVRL